jgi:hypothetical protein
MNGRGLKARTPKQLLNAVPETQFTKLCLHSLKWSRERAIRPSVHEVIDVANVWPRALVKATTAIVSGLDGPREPSPPPL